MLWSQPHHDGSQTYVLGTRLVGVAGSADLEADPDGFITLPSDGPAFGMWILQSK